MRWLALTDITILHPQAAALEPWTPCGYLLQDLTNIISQAAELHAVMAPILVTPGPRGYRRLTGHRTFAILTHVLDPEALVPVVVILGRLTPALVEQLVRFGLFSYPLLSSLDRTALYQLHAVAAALFSGYLQPTAGRPARGQRQPTPAGIDGVVGPLTTAHLAQCCGSPPSTLRRGPTRRRCQA